MEFFWWVLYFSTIACWSPANMLLFPHLIEQSCLLWLHFWRFLGTNTFRLSTVTRNLPMSRCHHIRMLLLQRKQDFCLRIVGEKQPQKPTPKQVEMNWNKSKTYIFYSFALKTLLFHQVPVFLFIFLDYTEHNLRCTFRSRLNIYSCEG